MTREFDMVDNEKIVVRRFTSPVGVQVFVDWDRDGYFDGAWEDLTDLVGEVFTERGESAEFGTVAVGQADIQLYDKEHAWSLFREQPVPGFGPGAGVFIQALAGGVIRPLFHGYVERVAFSHRPEEPTAIILTAHDLLGKLRDVNVKLETMVDTNTPSVLDAVLDAAGIPESQRDIDIESDPITIVWGDEKSAYQWLRDLATAFGYTFFVRKDGVLAVRGRGFHTPRQVQFVLTGIESASYDYSLEEAVTDVEIIGKPLRVESTVSVVWQILEQFILNPNEERFVEALFASPAYNVQTPVAGTDYTAQDDAGNDRTSYLSVYMFPSKSRSAVLLLRNTYFGPLTVTKLQLRGQKVIELDKIKRTVENVRARALLGRRERRIEAEWIQQLSVLDGIASYWGNRLERPPIGLELVYLSSLWGSLPTDVLEAELGDVVVVPLPTGDLLGLVSAVRTAFSQEEVAVRLQVDRIGAWNLFTFYLRDVWDSIA